MILGMIVYDLLTCRFTGPDVHLRWKCSCTVRVIRHDTDRDTPYALYRLFRILCYSGSYVTGRSTRYVTSP